MTNKNKIKTKNKKNYKTNQKIERLKRLADQLKSNITKRKLVNKNNG